MQVSSINSLQHFTARVSDRFIEAGESYYDKNSTLTRAREFRKQVRNVETYGHPESEIKFSKNKEKGSYRLILRNEELAPNKHIVLCNKDQFRKVLEYFSHLNDGKIRFAEKRLTGEIQ